VSTVVWFKIFYLFPSKSVAFRLNYAFLAKSLQFKLMQRLLRHLINVSNLCLLQGTAYMAVLCLLPTDNCYCCFFIYL